MYLLREIPYQFFVGQPLSRNGLDGLNEPVSIFTLALVEPERLLVKIAEQMKRLNANIRAFDRTLQKTPKVLNAVRVNISPNILNGMVNNLMDVFSVKAAIRLAVRKKFRAGLNKVPNAFMKRLAVSIFDDSSSDFALTLKQSHHGNFTNRPAPFNHRFPFALVHVARFAANVCFINFDLTRKFLKRACLHRKADSVQEKPCALLSNAKRTVNLIRRDAVLRISNEPDCREPLIKADRRVFHDSSDLDGKLLVTRFVHALPLAASRKIRNGFALTMRASHAIRPTKLSHECIASIKVREKLDCFLKCFRKIVFVLHAEILA